MRPLNHLLDLTHNLVWYHKATRSLDLLLRQSNNNKQFQAASVKPMTIAVLWDATPFTSAILTLFLPPLSQ